MSRILQTAVGCLIVLGVTAMSAGNVEQNTGWKVLFDGKALDAWRVYKQPSVSAGWKIENGLLARVAAGGDLITKEQFGDFELELDWKIAEGSNSGIFFRGTEESETIWHGAPEMQILDNARHADGKNPLTSTGSNYAVHPPVRDVSRPIGEWNSVRLIAKGTHVEHWLNGVKVVDYELFSPDWDARVKKSKFVKYPQYGRAPRGHIGLQDHGNPVWFRNIRIRPL